MNVPIATHPIAIRFVSVSDFDHSNGRVREGNGTLLQYSCLGNPMDGGAW